MVSTTSNLLRTLHWAFSLEHDGERPTDIMLVIIDHHRNTLLSDVRVHCGYDCARDLNLAEEECRLYRNEFLFEWQIPDACVIKEISLHTLKQRGLDLNMLIGEDALCSIAENGFANLSGFRDFVVSKWQDADYFNTCYSCARMALCFGSDAPWQEIYDNTLNWTRVQRSPLMMGEAFQDANLDYSLDLDEKLTEYEALFGEAALELDDLYDAHVDNVGELICNFGDETLTLEKHLDAERTRFAAAQAVVERSIAQMYVEIGF